MTQKARQILRAIRDSDSFPKKRQDFFLLLLGCAHLTSISATQVFLSGLICFVLYRIYTREYSFSVFPYTKYYIVIISLILISALYWSGIRDPFKRLLFWWIYLFFVAMFFVSYYDETGTLLKKFCIYLTLSADIAAILGLYQYFFAGIDRSLGFFSHQLTYSNSLGIVVCMIVAILLCRLYTSDAQLKFYAISLPIISVALASSISRGPMISTILTLMLILGIRFRKHAISICVAVVLIWVASIAAIPNYRTRYLQLFDKSWNDPSTSVGVRVALWETSWKIICDHPLLGIGQHNFKKVAFDYTGEYYHTMAHAHNMYLQFALTNGVPALIAMLILIAKWLNVIILSVREKVPYGLVGLSVLVVFLLEGLTENSLGDSEVAMLFFSFFGVLLGQMQRTKDAVLSKSC
jgi:O-antigen ligase